MATDQHIHYIRSLNLAALQLKFALQAESAAHAPLQLEGANLEKSGVTPFPQLLNGMTYGGLHIGADDLQLSADEVALASNGLKHCSILTLAVVIDSAFENIFRDQNRFKSSNEDIKTAATIARILRNAYTHNPFFPKWKFDNPDYIGNFVIPNVIAINTEALNDLDVKWQHYGGPLSLLLFLRYSQKLLCSYLGIEMENNCESIEVVGGLFAKTHINDNFQESCS